MNEKLEKLIGSEYVDGNESVRYIKVDKTGDKITVCIHSSVPFAIKNMESTKDEIGPKLLKDFETQFSIDSKPLSIKNHKWRYSQVYKSDYQGENFITLEPNFYLSGDAFAKSGNFLSCIDTAYAVASELSKGV